MTVFPTLLVVAMASADPAVAQTVASQEQRPARVRFDPTTVVTATEIVLGEQRVDHGKGTRDVRLVVKIGNKQISVHLEARPPPPQRARAMRDGSPFTERGPRPQLRLRLLMNGATSIALNIGRCGLCTEMMRVLPVGTVVEGLISSDGRDRPFTGRVVWPEGGDFRMGRMGIEFHQVDPELVGSLAGSETTGPHDTEPGRSSV